MVAVLHGGDSRGVVLLGALHVEASRGSRLRGMPCSIEGRDMHAIWDKLCIKTGRALEPKLRQQTTLRKRKKVAPRPIEWCPTPNCWPSPSGSALAP